MVDKAILNTVKFSHIIYNYPACFSYKVLYTSISANRYTDTNETFTTGRIEETSRTEKASGGRIFFEPFFLLLEPKTIFFRSYVQSQR